MYGSGRRTVLQPAMKRLDRSIWTTGTDFDAAIDEIDCVTLDAKRFSNALGAGTKEHALHAPGNPEQAAHVILLKAAASGTRIAGRCAFRGGKRGHGLVFRRTRIVAGEPVLLTGKVP